VFVVGDALVAALPLTELNFSAWLTGALAARTALGAASIGASLFLVGSRRADPSLPDIALPFVVLALTGYAIFTTGREIVQGPETARGELTSIAERATRYRVWWAFTLATPAGPREVEVAPRHMDALSARFGACLTPGSAVSLTTLRPDRLVLDASCAPATPAVR
jgi:hypothetical protein